MKLQCVHRHTQEEHPGCFATGNVNIAQAKDIQTAIKAPWYKAPEYRIGYFDIESDGLKADFSTMLSWAIKEKDGKNVYDVISREELFSGDADYHIIKSIVNEIKEYKILVGYYSKRFDMPYIRTKALYYGIDFPEFGTMYHFDLYDHVKRNLNLSRRSLDNVCDYLGIVGKTPLSKDMWRKAKYGDPEALAGVVEHNLGDTEITEQLHNRITPFSKWARSSI